MADTGERVLRKYGGFRGVDFRGAECELSRSPDAVNVWKSYKGIDGIETRPAMKHTELFTDPVYGIFFFRGVMIVHSGTKLYTVTNGTKKVIFSSAKAVNSSAFVYEKKWYFKDGTNYISYDGSSVKNVEEDAYVPVTSIGRTPTGGGTQFQDVNLLSPYRINKFVANGRWQEVEVEGENDPDNKEYVGDRAFHLDARDIDKGFVPVVKHNDVAVTNFTVDYTNGIITFTKAPEAPLTAGQSNVEILFKKTNSDYPDQIKKCTLLQVFDNRVFFSGNPDYPSVIWHCALDDPSYCPDTNYYEEGMDDSPIRGLVAGNNAIWVFREPSDANTTIFYHNPVSDDVEGKIYPSQHSSISVGCVGRAVNFGDDIVFFSERGMEGISGDITTEQVLAHRSTLVDPLLTAEKGYKDMILAEWSGYLLVIINSRVYLADSRNKFAHNNHYEYEWFYWELGREITCATVFEGVLFLGSEGGIYTLTDYHTAINSHWTTPKDKFTLPQKTKTTNKRGCVVECGGDVTVLSKTEGSEFEEVGSFESVKDHCVPRIKCKKFKDIQLKFMSDTRFTLESATLECYIGGYIKR